MIISATKRYCSLPSLRSIPASCHTFFTKRHSDVPASHRFGLESYWPGFTSSSPPSLHIHPPSPPPPLPPSSLPSNFLAILDDLVQFLSDVFWVFCIFFTLFFWNDCIIRKTKQLLIRFVEVVLDVEFHLTEDVLGSNGAVCERLLLRCIFLGPTFNRKIICVG